MSFVSLIGPLKKQINRKLKFDIVRFPWAWSLDANLLGVISECGVDTIIDVGANEGQFALRIRELGFVGSIHSFEPLERTFKILSKTSAEDKNWCVHNFALGRAVGDATINVSNATDLSSLLNPNAFGSEQYRDIKVSRREKVAKTTLDEFLSNNKNVSSDRILLKIDTQGYDLEVFAGAKLSLGRIRCILSEISFMPLYDGMPSYLQALAEYNKWGFYVRGIYPISRNDDG